jgi:hypothetical protein
MSSVPSYNIHQKHEKPKQNQCEESQDDNVISSFLEEIISKPIKVPESLDEILEKRIKLKKTINVFFKLYKRKNPFFNEEKQPLPADDIVSFILNLYRKLFEYDKMYDIVTAMKTTDIVVPSFLLGCKSYPVSLATLIDETLLSYLISIHDSIMKQMETINNICDKYNEPIDNYMKERLDNVESQFKTRIYISSFALNFGKDEVNLDKENIIESAEKKKARRVDSVNINAFLITLEQFIQLLQNDKVEKIKSCGVEPIIKELEMLQHITNKLKETKEEQYEQDYEFKSPRNETVFNSIFPNDFSFSTKTKTTTVSITELALKIKVLDNLINCAIQNFRIISYKKGEDGLIEEYPHNINNGFSHLVEIFKNIQIILQLRNIYHRTMSFKFVTHHPLTGSPCNLISAIRMKHSNSTSFPCLNKVLKLFTSLLNNARKRYNTLSTTHSNEVYFSDNIGSTKEYLGTLLDTIDKFHSNELPLIGNKLYVTVPDHYQMDWIKE